MNAIYETAMYVIHALRWKSAWIIARPKGVLPKAARPKGGLFR